jgi:hypothetical protein
MYIYSLSSDCDAKQEDAGLAGELFFPPNLHLLTLIEKQVDVGLAGKIIFPAKPTSTHSYWKTSRCEVGGINNSPTIFASTCFYLDFHAKQVDVKLVGKL